MESCLAGSSASSGMVEEKFQKRGCPRSRNTATGEPCDSGPQRELHSEQVHHHFTRFSATANLYVKASRTNQLLFSFARIGVRLWNSIPKELRIKNRTPFKRELKNRLLKLLENEEMNVDIRCSEICKYLLIK